ncbi:MAG TPA: hypothetical protein VJ942_06840 [Roseovarius sp.]|nr:hypothetical protein [Roseovarius sp.]
MCACLNKTDGRHGDLGVDGEDELGFALGIWGFPLDRRAGTIIL